jgi:DNA invertase Pin-like site-specific DNA recombinase
MTEPKKAAGYVRVSTPGQVEDKESLTTQRDGIALYCNAHGLELVQLYADEGISGASTEKRPAFMQLLQDAKARKFDYLIIHSLSRFGRNTKETINNYDLLESYGVKLIFLKENLDTSTPSGRMFRNMLAVFAEWERDVIKERMQDNKIAKWKKGGSFIGKVPFGYQWSREKKAVEINPQEAQIYQHIVDLYLHEGLSDLNIALRLKEEGIKFRGLKFPATQTIAYMLNNPAYYGNYVLNKHEYVGDRRTGKMKPASQHITFPIPALISKTKWDEIQAKRAFNKAKSKRTSLAQEYFLRDLLTCDECGGKIVAVTHSRPRADNSLPRYYGCYHHKTSSKRLEASGRTRCKLPLINAEKIEDMVWSEIIQILTFGGFQVGGEYKPSKLETLVETAQYDEQIARFATALRHLELELKGKHRAKERVIALLESEEYDQEDFRQKLAKLNDEIITIKSSVMDNQVKIETLNEAKANSAAFVEFVRGNQEWLASIREELNALSPMDKKRLVESLIDGKIAVWLGRLEPGETGPEWAIGNFKFSFNQAIFETLASEGKLPIFNKNGGNRSGSPGAGAPRPPKNQWPPPGNRGHRRTASPRPGASHAAMPP